MEVVIKCEGQKDKKLKVKTPSKRDQINALKDPTTFSFTKSLVQGIIDNAPKNVVEKLKRVHAKMRKSKNNSDRELGELFYSMNLKFKE